MAVRQVLDAEIPAIDERAGTGFSQRWRWGWTTAVETATYEYCCHTTNNNICDGRWTHVGSSTNAAIAGLMGGVTCYWQDRV
jgi:hypothetical protein